MCPDINTRNFWFISTVASEPSSKYGLTSLPASNMRIVFVLAALVAVAVASPQSAAPSKIIPIVQYDEKHDDFGQFALSYTTGDGTQVTEQGVLKPNADGTGHVLVLSGSHKYTSPEGIPIALTFTADENGYKAIGDHLPVAPVA